MLWSIDSSQNGVSADQYHLTVPRLKCRPIEVEYFWRYPLTNYQFQMIAGSSLFFPMIHIKYVGFMSLWPHTVKILISNWSRTRKFSQFFKNTGGEDLFLPWSRCTSIFMPWLVKIWQMGSCGKFMYHLESCLLWGCLHDTGATFARSEFTPVPSHGSIFVYMIPPQNVTRARVTSAWVHPGSCTGARISLRHEISQQYHVDAKRPPVWVWNGSAGRLERVAYA